MLEQVLKEIHNWFQVDVIPGKYTIQDGGITLPFLRDGQYFRIMGSVFNDGLHRYGPEMEVLQDETFDGAVWALAIPKAVLDVVVETEKEAADWKAKYGEIAQSPYTSESFGGYSYTKSSGGDADESKADAAWWVKQCARRLNAYRKLREI